MSDANIDSPIGPRASLEQFLRESPEAIRERCDQDHSNINNPIGSDAFFEYNTGFVLEARSVGWGGYYPIDWRLTYRDIWSMASGIKVHLGEIECRATDIEIFRNMGRGEKKLVGKGYFGRYHVPIPSFHVEAFDSGDGRLTD